MATIKKSYSDLQQSKKLAEILPIESADMIWVLANPDLPMIKAIAYKDSEKSKYYETLPAWSLAALLDVLPKNLNIGRPSLESNYKGYYWIQYYDEFMQPNNYKTECFNNPVDACVAMVEKLHELKLL